MQGNGPEPTDDQPVPEGTPVGGEQEEQADPREARIQELEAKLRDVEGRLRAVSKAYADLRNDNAAYRQRLEAQDKARVERKEAEVVESFFDPVQNLHRSIEVGHGEGLLDGLRMVHQQFMRTLHDLGLERVPGDGATFDPNIHEAVAITPVDDPALDDKVVVVHRDGWRVRGKLLTPAQVTVGRYTPAAEA